jgi:hypothetical protein
MDITICECNVVFDYRSSEQILFLPQSMSTGSFTKYSNVMGHAYCCRYMALAAYPFIHCFTNITYYCFSEGQHAHVHI